MDLLALSPFAVAAAAPAAAFGLARAAAALTPVARQLDVRHPWLLVVAGLWASAGPLLLAMTSAQAWLAPAAVFVWGGLAIALADLAALRAPHAVSAAFGAAGLVSAMVWAPDRAIGAALAAAGAFVLLHAARISFRRARGKAGLGGGDPGVMAALAAWLGPVAAPWCLALGAVATLAVFALRRLDPGRAPLATCLVAASLPVAMLSALLWGTPFWATGAP